MFSFGIQDSQGGTIVNPLTGIILLAEDHKRFSGFQDSQEITIVNPLPKTDLSAEAPPCPLLL